MPPKRRNKQHRRSDEAETRPDDTKANNKDTTTPNRSDDEKASSMDVSDVKLLLRTTMMEVVRQRGEVKTC